ncbi:major facilitator superfamily transporter [Colletotrichum musicola]|uniref:Major facilitator superfamily transporter n=1 Tax=Colletotrichum musicola TaxID=2175873 RepID=A0A8H6JA89_9PEZI|nr:major facilitator superfamily transporter [Colletotrichum musicola]
MSGFEYNIVLSVTFAGYVAISMILTRLRLSWYLSGCMIACGIVSGLSATVQNFAGLAVNRFFLGITEAPFFVGCAFLFSGRYTQKELGLRLGAFFCAAMISGAFGSVFAASIAAAFANNRMASWRWLFIVEGIATVVFAVTRSFTIPDWPATTG